MSGAARVVAHRGAWGPAAPQNSLAAFERAIAVGADAVELDVRRTADGRPVVVHDARIGLRMVARLTAAELRRRRGAEGAADLADVLAALAGRIAVDVELKEDRQVAETVELVVAALPPADVVITSFLDEALVRVRAVAPELRTGLLVGSRRRLPRLEERLRATGADLVAPHVSLLRAGLLEWAAERAIPVWPWTVNDPARRRALLADPRVEAVITDDAAQAVAEARAVSRPE